MSSIPPYNNGHNGERGITTDVNTSKGKATPPDIAKWRFVLAFCVALAADTLGIPCGEYFVVIFDVVVALVLIVILGFNWMIIPALLIECVPGLGLFPSWVMAVLAITGWKAIKRN
jgi:hypothetical protein